MANQIARTRNFSLLTLLHISNSHLTYIRMKPFIWLLVLVVLGQQICLVNSQSDQLLDNVSPSQPPAHTTSLPIRIITNPTTPSTPNPLINNNPSRTARSEKIINNNDMVTPSPSTRQQPASSEASISAGKQQVVFWAVIGSSAFAFILLVILALAWWRSRNRRRLDRKNSGAINTALFF